MLGDLADRHAIAELPNGNAYRRYREEATEDGVTLAVHRFEISSYLPPAYYRLALFTFVVPKADEQRSDIQRQMAFCDRELQLVQFSPVVKDWER
jgi:hypothetical protein